MTVASINLPRSCMCFFVRYSESGGYAEHMTRMATMKHIEESASPAMKSRPNMVENQCAFTDMIQSVDMNVTANAEKISPGAEIAAIACRGRTPPSRSSVADQRF